MEHYIKEIKEWANTQINILEVTDFKSKDAYHYWIDELTITSSVEDLKELKDYIDDFDLYYIKEEIFNDIKRLIKKYSKKVVK